MDNLIKKPLFIFEMANNHMGDIEHGLKIVDEIAEVVKQFEFDFAIKLQYRDIDSFIHPAYKDRKDVKYVKRFLETRLSKDEFRRLKDRIVAKGFRAICTPFDERSVDLVVEHGFEIIKIASCSLTDWPLLEKIVLTKKPVIFSTAGAELYDIDRVVSFFSHRENPFAIMHCVGEYPTNKSNLQLNQIDFLRHHYADAMVGFSTHEDPENFEAVKMAIAKSARIFERHVGLKTEKYEVNAYSSTPEQLSHWLAAAKDAFEMCGVESMRHGISEKEKKDLAGLKRGVFAVKEIKKGERVNLSNTYFAIPNGEGQVLANDFSKYIEFTAQETIGSDAPVNFRVISINDKRGKVLEIVDQIKKLLIDSKIFLPNRMDLELSHHYGLDRYKEHGAAIINCINREYCKKIIILLPGQKHPIHHHKIKEETFHVLYGGMKLSINGTVKEYKAGSMIVVERSTAHGFSTDNGCIFEEVSTTHFKDDSFYDDEEIKNNSNRKTELTFWADWLNT